MPFGYFGRKGRLAGFYPEPEHDVIVEPFAGSAAYSLYGERWRNDVILVDSDERLMDLWRWLISFATEDDILSLPEIRKGDEIPTGHPKYDLIRLSAPSENWHGKSIVTDWMARDWTRLRARAIDSLPKIRHWIPLRGNYDAVNELVVATWFVDPPYQKVDYGYSNSRDTLDYGKLADWTLSRPGQVIACDEVSADWLPFKELKPHRTLNNTKKVEGVWLSEWGRGNAESS